jgi:hypothetical protein
MLTKGTALAALTAICLCIRVPLAAAQIPADDFSAGIEAGRDAARQSGDVLSLPYNVLPEPMFGADNNPALRGPEWRDGYREGYRQGEEENRERMCAYGVSPYPCR